MTSPLYTLKNLHKRFGEREVLNIESLSLDAGKIYGLLGPNGAGKTTLMKILSFMDTPTGGELAFQGQVVRPEHAARHRARVVWVPQSPVMFTGSLLYNVEYPMMLKGIRGKARYGKAMELLETVNLAHLAKAPAHKLSGGEAQRGSIARALAAGAEVILFDEPTASVDFRSRGELIAVIRDLRRVRGLSIVVTTHDAELAAELCQEQIILFDGRVVPHYPTASSAPGSGGGVVSGKSSGFTDKAAGLLPAPARLEQRPEGLTLVLPPHSESAGTVAAVYGIVEQDGGVSLRLRLAQGNSLDVLAADAAGMALARTLTLGSTLLISSELA